ncbi:MAG: LysM domain-containing protein, partial [Cyanobacteriota bacterium]|nr:LysM domain-containing protein [Cyanobacteriota bacterium]
MALAVVIALAGPGLRAQLNAPLSSVRVAAGDTLEAIALRQGTTVEALLRANPGVNPLALQVGQSLRLPPPRGVVRIAPGDTLEAIALREG